MPSCSSSRKSLLTSFMLFGQQLSWSFLSLQISQNITTNEVANSMRYSYLKGPGGRFRNPYDHGIRKNCSDFLIKGYNEDMELPEQIAPSEEMGMIQMTRSTDSQNGENHSHQSNNINVCVDGQSKNSRTHGHVNPSKCCNNIGKNDRAPHGLGLGVGRNARHNTRSILPLWSFRWHGHKIILLCIIFIEFFFFFPFFWVCM